MPDKKRPDFWRKLVGRGPKERTVHVNGYNFSQLTSNKSLPQDTAMLGRIASAIDAVNITLGPDRSFANKITLNPDDHLAVNTRSKGENRTGRLTVGPANFKPDVADSSLTAALHHEGEHLNQDFFTLAVGRLLSDYKPQSSEFIIDCRQNENEVIRDLVNTYRPRKLLNTLDSYIAVLERQQKNLQANLSACEKSPYLKSLIEFNRQEPAWNTISQSAYAAIVYDMEGDQKLYREAKESLESRRFPENYDPFAKFSEDRKAKDGKTAKNRKIKQHVMEKIEAKIQRILDLDEKNNELATPLFKLGVCIQWAEELRCDRVSARRNTDRIDTVQNRTVETESPFGLAEYLKQTDAIEEGSISHPNYDTRVTEAAKAAIGRYTEDLMLSGAPEQDARKIAETRVREEATAKNIQLPNTIHPVDSPETNAARRDYKSHVEQLKTNKQRNQSPER